MMYYVYSPPRARALKSLKPTVRTHEAHDIMSSFKIFQEKYEFSTDPLPCQAQKHRTSTESSRVINWASGSLFEVLSIDLSRALGNLPFSSFFLFLVDISGKRMSEMKCVNVKIDAVMFCWFIGVTPAYTSLIHFDSVFTFFTCCKGTTVRHDVVESLWKRWIANSPLRPLSPMFLVVPCGPLWSLQASLALRTFCTKSRVQTSSPNSTSACRTS